MVLSIFNVDCPCKRPTTIDDGILTALEGDPTNHALYCGNVDDFNTAQFLVVVNVEDAVRGAHFALLDDTKEQCRGRELWWVGGGDRRKIDDQDPLELTIKGLFLQNDGTVSETCILVNQQLVLSNHRVELIRPQHINIEGRR